MTIRVRFAPSPTGLLHIGNARAALINWLFARHHQLKGHQAQFLLRLDDTDLERSSNEFARAIEEDLSWLGITYDLFAKQSDRFDRYDEMRDSLIASGRLYPCYETVEELDFKRKRQLSRGEPPIYDRSALQLTDAERRAYEQEGRRPHWRFKLEPKPMVWTDLVRGPTEFHGDRLSDPVLVRADGAYLYTLTSVVDDIDFKISHIIRGEDHVTNTAVQIQLFEALGRDPETICFAHTTLLLDAQGGPLSKRLGSLSLKSLRELGIEPMAINSLLARLGTSLPVEPRLTMVELAADFDLTTFSRTPPRFDPHELETLNQKLLHHMPFDLVRERLHHLGHQQINDHIWQVIHGNISKFSDVAEWEDICFGTITPTIEDKEYIALAKKYLPPEPWTDQTWSLWTQHLKEITGRKGKQLYMPLRQALTGHDHGPEMKDLLPIIGYRRTVERLSTKL
jgi:glutamyl-tRNA synthetase